MFLAIKPVVIPSENDDAAAPANKVRIQTVISVVFIIRVFKLNVKRLLIIKSD
jgi:hypothetical protein